jgi:putative transcriptional regulator
MPKTYKSEALAAVHEMMEGLHEGGAIDKRTLREFDAACLVSVRSFGPDEIKAIREEQHVSQPVFARYLNVSKSVVSAWECGKRKPTGAALKLLSIVKHKGIEAVA